MLTKEINIEKAKILRGWMSDVELSFLAQCAGEAKTIIEIGSYEGKSARALADNSSPEATIYCVDPWNAPIFWKDNNMFVVNESTFGMFQINMLDHLKTKKVIPVCKKWSEATVDIPADFIFIDGDHSYEAVKHDIIKALKHLKSGGILAGHDNNWPGVVKAVKELLTEYTVRNEETIWWIQKS